MSADTKHAEAWFARRSPWCDACKQPAVFSEAFGMLHSTAEFPFGLPPHLDPTAHDVTMREWNAS